MIYDVATLAIDHGSIGSDFERWIWTLVGIMAIIALAIYILRSLR